MRKIRLLPDLGWLLVLGTLTSFSDLVFADLGALSTYQVPPQNAEACRDFYEFSTQRKKDPKYVANDHSPLGAMNSDSVLVLQDGKKVFEWYDGVNARAGQPHLLWSASKDVTGLLLARTIQLGKTFQGRPVTMKTRLADFFPYEQEIRIHPEMGHRSDPNQRQKYEAITLENLVQMSSGFVWEEFYDSNLTKSTFMPMLYTTGHQNMSQFALNAPLIPEGPGRLWNYSGGNMNILMAIMAKIYDDNAETFPWQILFGPLGIEQARIERDGSGHFVGSSYIYLSTRDLAQLGQLLLQDGQCYWVDSVDTSDMRGNEANGHSRCFLKNEPEMLAKYHGRGQMIPLILASWTKDAQHINDAVLTSRMSADTIKDLGTESRRIFWLNQDIERADGTLLKTVNGKQVHVLYPQEMPEAPKDMYFAAGHYGQLLIVIPSQKTVIIRTGADVKYWDMIQPLVVKALACSVGYRAPFVKDLTPPSAKPKKDFVTQLFTSILPAVPDVLHSYEFLEKSGIAAAYLAKELCSHLFVENVAQKMSSAQWESSFDQRLGIPKPIINFIRFNTTTSIDPQRKTVQVGTYHIEPWENSPADKKVFTNLFEAHLGSDSRYGCELRQLIGQ